VKEDFAGVFRFMPISYRARTSSAIGALIDELVKENRLSILEVRGDLALARRIGGDSSDQLGAAR
jgi:hypothetical protein